MTRSSDLTNPGSRLDIWRHNYSDRAAGMVASEVRALFSVANQPEIVSLAGGMPNVSALPLQALGELVGKVIGDSGAKALQYGSAQGDLGLREAICEVMLLEGIHANPENVVTTVGSQQGLDLLAKIFFNPGDVVLTEGPTYVTAIGTFLAYQAEIVHIPMDDQGIIPAELVEALSHLTKAGKKVKAIYTVPTFQNPTGVTLSLTRRNEILDICVRAGVLIIEDNPYGLLCFDERPLRAIYADSPPESVIYLGSFSKTLAPGLRVGWVLAPPAVRDRLVLAAESAMLSHSVFSQMIVEQYLRTQPWEEQLSAFRSLYSSRCEAMLQSLASNMPADVNWTSPKGGFFIWLTLPDGLHSKKMLARAIQSRVAYVPGTGFYVDNKGQENIRLSYSFPPEIRIAQGIERLAGVIREEKLLRDTFSEENSRENNVEI
jgi:2-aminoadipate transaminase